MLTCTPWQWEIFVTAVKDGAFNGESWPDHGQRCACSDGIGCRCRRRARRPSSEGDSSWASTHGRGRRYVGNFIVRVRPSTPERRQR